MKGCLKNAQVRNEPEDTREVINSTVKSPLGNIWMWVVVEDEDDQTVYEKFMHKHMTRVHISRLADGSKGCANVELIVREILEQGVTKKIVGIRDADYTRYLEYDEHPNIKRTDEHDLEMQMLGTPSVREGLEAWHPNVAKHLKFIIEKIARKRGCMRMMNAVYNLQCSFHEEGADIKKLWDSTSGRLVEDWEERLYQDFLKHCTNVEVKSYPIRKKDIADFVRKKNLDKLSDSKLCQGHDVVMMLQYHLKHEDYNAVHITKKMTELYSLEDFKHTTLYGELEALQEKVEVNYLKK